MFKSFTNKLIEYHFNKDNSLFQLSIFKINDDIESYFCFIVLTVNIKLTHRQKLLLS
jgi:hypothetical protein